MSKKQTYIVQDSIMNGTVTIQTVISGIEANSFEEAKTILKRKLVEFGFQVNRDTDEEISYSWVPEGKTKEMSFPTYGHMTYEPIHYIE
jgi:hypothetical protein